MACNECGGYREELVLNPRRDFMLTLDPPLCQQFSTLSLEASVFSRRARMASKGVRPRPVAGAQLVASLTALDGLRMKPGGHSPQLGVQAIWSSRRVPPLRTEAAADEPPMR
jgi:hypothetical protein